MFYSFIDDLLYNNTCNANILIQHRPISVFIKRIDRRMVPCTFLKFQCSLHDRGQLDEQELGAEFHEPQIWLEYKFSLEFFPPL